MGEVRSPCVGTSSLDLHLLVCLGQGAKEPGPAQPSLRAAGRVPACYLSPCESTITLLLVLSILTDTFFHPQTSSHSFFFFLF